MSFERQAMHMYEYIANEVKKINNNYVYAIWDELMDKTPVDTGTLKFNWRVAPGESGGTYNKLRPKDGTKNYYGEPTRPNLEKYPQNWKQMRIYNNTPYIMDVEENNYKNPTAKTAGNRDFIKNSVAAAKLRVS